MTSLLIAEDLYPSGDKPLHRTATLGDKMVLTAQGTRSGSEWVLGWPIAHGIHWQPILEASALISSARNRPEPLFQSAVLIGELFYEVDNGLRLSCGKVAGGIDRVLGSHDGEPPTLFVFVTDGFELETIFDLETGLTTFATALPSTETPEAFASLVAAFHADPSIRKAHPDGIAELIYTLCKENEVETSGGERHTSSWHKNLPTR